MARVYIRVPVADRFWPKVAKSDGCWTWLGSKNSLGYGSIHVSGRGLQKAHRVAYELMVGPIADGLQLDHLCRNPSCVNPAHLEPVTGRENTLRGINPAAVHARQTHCKRGHPFDEKNTRVSSRGNRICAACTPFLPSRIAKRRQWPLTETKVPA